MAGRSALKRFGYILSTEVVCCGAPSVLFKSLRLEYGRLFEVVCDDTWLLGDSHLSQLRCVRAAATLFSTQGRFFFPAWHRRAI